MPRKIHKTPETSPEAQEEKLVQLQYIKHLKAKRKKAAYYLYRLRDSLQEAELAYGIEYVKHLKAEAEQDLRKVEQDLRTAEEEYGEERPEETAQKTAQKELETAQKPWLQRLRDFFNKDYQRKHRALDEVEYLEQRMQYLREERDAYMKEEGYIESYQKYLEELEVETAKELEEQRKYLERLTAQKPWLQRLRDFFNKDK